MTLSTRSTEPEWMDGDAVDPAELARCLADLSTVNTLTLARRPTLAFMRRVTRGRPNGRRLSVLDVGSGAGDMLRRLARWGRRRGIQLELEGLDLHPASAIAAEQATPAALGIRFRTGNVFDEPPLRRDVVISSLFTHHLSDDQIVHFLRWMEQSATVGWFINDLHRHPIPYHGFTALSRAARWHSFVQHDGPVSIARAFHRQDWARLLRQAGLRDADVRWQFPFRLCVSRIRCRIR